MPMTTKLIFAQLCRNHVQIGTKLILSHNNIELKYFLLESNHVCKYCVQMNLYNASFLFDFATKT